ncbi:MAG: HAMP domain-containing histidine kinase [Clostridia bacterium]|nr:HAMP domain-containing histidine kinase [Clostridia bacterium]
MNKYKTLRSKITVFTLCAIIIANIITSLIIALLIAIGLVHSRFMMTIWLPIAFLITSGILGTALASIMSKQIIKPLDRLSKATQEVAKGDFSIRLKEDTNVQAVNSLLENFNKMAAELGSIEMFRSDFINNFSHEFKTPIVSICGFARQLQKDDLTEDEQKKYARIIASNAQHLASMSSSVLLLTKLDTQQIIEGKETYSLDNQIRGCILSMQSEWERKNIILTVDLAEVSYCGNREILGHIWSNLIANAIKFSHENGEITITMEEKDNAVHVRIQDNGIGIDKEIMPHIFEKFYQGDSSHKTSGNGLGLPLVKRIIELCKGEIKVESVKDEGSIFTITLPNE